MVEDECAGFSHLLNSCIKVHIHPVATFLILYLTRNGIFPRINAYASGYIYKEDIPASIVCNPAFPYADRCLGNSHGMFVGIHLDVFLYPVDQ